MEWVFFFCRMYTMRQRGQYSEKKKKDSQWKLRDWISLKKKKSELTNTLWTTEGPGSSYSPFEIHICWKWCEKSPPIHTRWEQSPWSSLWKEATPSVTLSCAQKSLKHGRAAWRRDIGVRIRADVNAERSVVDSAWLLCQWHLVGKNTRTTETFSTDSADVSVWELHRGWGNVSFVISSTIFQDMIVPLDNTTLTYKFLRMSALHFMKEVSWTPLASSLVKLGWQNTFTQWKRLMPTVMTFPSGSSKVFFLSVSSRFELCVLV